MWPVPSGCIGIHTVKIYQARSRQFFGWFVAILPVCCRDRDERILAVRTRGVMFNSPAYIGLFTVIGVMFYD